MKSDEQLAIVVATLAASGADADDVVFLGAAFAAYQSLERRFYFPRVPFALSDYDDLRSQDRFRFTPSEITFLASALRLPAVVHTRQSVPVPRTEALCLVLRRLSYPNRLKDLSQEFGRDPSVLSSAINRTLAIIHWRVRKKMEFDTRVFETYAPISYQKIKDKARRDVHCVGFIDGTIRRICRPVRYQRVVYSGFKKCHCLKYQGITFANGLIVSLHGPVEGRRHDSFILSDSKIEERMRQYPNYKLYGDQGYPSRDYLVRPFTSANITPGELKFNKALSRCRVTVEWGFGEVAKYWAFNNYRENLKLFKSPVGSQYIVSCFFTNCLNCAKQESGASEYFDCPLPDLRSYAIDFDLSPPQQLPLTEDGGDNGEENDSEVDSSDDEDMGDGAPCNCA